MGSLPHQHPQPWNIGSFLDPFGWTGRVKADPHEMRGTHTHTRHRIVSVPLSTQPDWQSGHDVVGGATSAGWTISSRAQKSPTSQQLLFEKLRAVRRVSLVQCAHAGARDRSRRITSRMQSVHTPITLDSNEMFLFIFMRVCVCFSYR